MPRYYFHLVDGGQRERDTEGTDLPDHRSARAAAIRFAGEVLVDAEELLSTAGPWRVEVTNPKGALLFTVVTSAIEAPKAEEVAAPGECKDSDDDQVGAFLQGSFRSA